MSMQTQRGRKVQNRRGGQPLRIFLIALGAIVIIGAAFLITVALSGGFGSNQNQNRVEVEELTVPVGTTPEGFYYKGDPNAPVKVVEYADFQCPACAAFARSLAPDIMRDYIETGKVQFIYHDFPLRQHPNAPKAAEAARCAGDQNRFWQMHDVIFARQTEWSALSSPLNRFTQYAEELGLNTSEFQSCLNSGKHSAQVVRAAQVSAQLNITGTPSFIVNNGAPISSAELTAAIEAALAAQGQ